MKSFFLKVTGNGSVSLISDMLLIEIGMDFSGSSATFEIHVWFIQNYPNPHRPTATFDFCAFDIFDTSVRYAEKEVQGIKRQSRLPSIHRIMEISRDRGCERRI
nr:unnamed protein product [Callosobruchus analis]